MPAERVPMVLLLLHEGGWDEVLMVAVALGIAYLVIVWSGRKRDHEDDDWEDDDEVPEDVRASDSPPERPTNTRS